MVEEFVKTRIGPGDTAYEAARLFEPHVTGVEVTQSIQYYGSSRHLTDAKDRQPDNGNEPVAFKAAWVRLYVDPSLFVDAERVTGTITVQRRNRQMLWDNVRTYSPVGSTSVLADSTLDYRSVRGTLWRTLNFVIPAKDFHGTLRIVPALTGARFPATPVVIAPRLIQTLRVRSIMVAYRGPSSANPPGPGQPPITQLVLPAPTLADLQSTSGKAFATMPVQATGSFASAGTLNWATPLDDMRTKAGACSTNWDTLLNWLELLRDNDGNRADVVYYGLLPSGIPLNVPGCGHDGLGAGAVGSEQTLVHEIGHGYGFKHTPSGDVGTDVDTKYPTYEPYQSASIGEFGLDIRNGAIYDPKDSTDYMSYGPNRWMSLYQDARLWQHPRLDPSWISEPSVFDDHLHIRPYDLEFHWWPDPPWLGRELESAITTPVISLVGQVDDEGRVSVQSAARVRVVPEVSGVPTEWVAQLLGDDGAVLSRAVVHRLSSVGGCGCGGEAESDPGRAPFRFKAYVPDVGPGAALRILNDAETDREVWLRRPERDAPVFTDLGLDLGNDSLYLRWQLDGDAESVAAQWTADQGETWHGLSVGLTDGTAELPLTGVPAGEVAIRLLAHGGFFTGESDILRIEVPPRAPEIAVLHPRDGQLLPAGGVVQVAGSAIDQGGRPLPDDALRWSLDGNDLGEGRELWVTAPDPGEHELTLVVRSDQGESTGTVRFSTEPFEVIG